MGYALTFAQAGFNESAQVIAFFFRASETYPTLFLFRFCGFHSRSTVDVNVDTRRRMYYCRDPQAMPLIGSVHDKHNKTLR